MLGRGAESPLGQDWVDGSEQGRGGCGGAAAVERPAHARSLGHGLHRDRVCIARDDQLDGGVEECVTSIGSTQTPGFGGLVGRLRAALEACRMAIKGGRSVDARNYATVTGILTDKLNILGGGVTSRSQSMVMRVDPEQTRNLEREIRELEAEIAKDRGE